MESSNFYCIVLSQVVCICPTIQRESFTDQLCPICAFLTKQFRQFVVLFFFFNKNCIEKGLIDLLCHCFLFIFHFFLPFLHIILVFFCVLIKIRNRLVPFVFAFFHPFLECVDFFLQNFTSSNEALPLALSLVHHPVSPVIDFLFILNVQKFNEPLFFALTLLLFSLFLSFVFLFLSLNFCL